jgi:hypothetical protein
LPIAVGVEGRKVAVATHKEIEERV